MASTNLIAAINNNQEDIFEKIIIFCKFRSFWAILKRFENVQMMKSYVWWRVMESHQRKVGALVPVKKLAHFDCLK